MALMILGLAIFLGIHSVRIFADPWRTQMIGRMGAGPWKGLFTLISIAGFVLLVIGFRQWRAESTVLYVSPGWIKHLTALLMVLAMILFVATYIPKNWFKARFHHPQVLAVKTWAISHLLAVGVVADVVLFGAFLVWAVLSFSAARRRDRANNTVYAAPTAVGTAITVATGLVLWSVFAMFLHGPLIGVRPLGY